MTIQEIHAEVKKMIPDSGMVSVTHSYNDASQEFYSVMVYSATINPDDCFDDCMFGVHAERTPEKLLVATVRAYEKYDPAAKKAAKIAKLKRQLAAMEVL